MFDYEVLYKDKNNTYDLIYSTETTDTYSLAEEVYYYLVEEKDAIDPEIIHIEPMIDREVDVENILKYSNY